jgi:hypothetical protein
MAHWVTRQAKNNYRCLFCSVDLVCPKCNAKRKMGTPFSIWLRQLGAPLNSQSVYNSDIDHVWWHYKGGWFITIEEKQYGAEVRKSQQEIIDIFSERLLKFAQATQKTLRGIRPVSYKGHYNIIFEKTSPLDSNYININGQNYQTTQLVYLLKNGELPKDEIKIISQIDKIVLDILPSFLK